MKMEKMMEKTMKDDGKRQDDEEYAEEEEEEEEEEEGDRRPVLTRWMLENGAGLRAETSR
jgi:hypothetical protein